MGIITERSAWIKSALTVDNGFPVIKIVNVSSFSEAIKLPNQDFLVSSGEDSGVGLYTGSMSTKKETINVLIVKYFIKKTIFLKNFIFHENKNYYIIH